MRIEKLIEQSMVRNAGLSRKTVRWFGGTKTSMRRAKCLAYAWRRHRGSSFKRLDRYGDIPFMFGVTTATRRDPKTGKPITKNMRVVGFVTEADRRRGIEYLRAKGCDYFTTFRDVNATYALMYAVPTAPAQTAAAKSTAGSKTTTLYSNRIK